MRRVLLVAVAWAAGTLAGCALVLQEPGGAPAGSLAAVWSARRSGRTRTTARSVDSAGSLRPGRPVCRSRPLAWRARSGGEPRVASQLDGSRRSERGGSGKSGTASVGAGRTQVAVADQDAHSVRLAAASAGDSLDQQSALWTQSRQPAPRALTLQQAVAWAVRHNPDLVAGWAREPVQHAAYHVAATYPYNPQLTAGVMPYTREADGRRAKVDQSYTLTETFELAGQPRHRKEAAAADWTETRWALQWLTVQVTAETERLFFEALFRRQVWELQRGLAELNERMYETIQHRFAAGQATQADVVLARVESQSSRQAAALAEAEYRTALAALRRHLNWPDGRELRLEGDLTAWQWRPLTAVGLEQTGTGLETQAGVAAGSDLSEPEEVLGRSAGATDNRSAVHASDGSALDAAWVAEWLESRPDVQAARAAVEAAQARWQLARANRVPNLQLGPAFFRDEAATEFWGLEAQVSLPVVNTGQPLVRQRWAELQQRRVELEQLLVKARLEIEAAVARYERARRLVEKLDSAAGQPVSSLLQPFQDQFEAGQIDLLHVLSARRSVLQSRRSTLDLVREVALAAADVTAATGVPAELLLRDGSVEHPLRDQPARSGERARSVEAQP